MKNDSPRRMATISEPWGKCKYADGTTRQRRARIQAVFEQPHGPARERFGIEGARLKDDPLDVCGQLRLWPHKPVDTDECQATFTFEFQEVFARDEAEGAWGAALSGDRAAHDIDFVEAGARHDDVGVRDTSAVEDI